MGKRTTKAKRSFASLPKGLPVRAGGSNRSSSNGRSGLDVIAIHNKKHKRGATAAGGQEAQQQLFEGRANKKLKHDVLNRTLKGSVRTSSTKTMARAMQSRQTSLKEALIQSKKSNQFHDRRIGVGSSSNNSYAQDINREDVILKRLVKERVMRSKRKAKYDLADDDDDNLIMTHGGKVIDPNTYSGKERDAHLIGSDDDDGDDDDKYYKDAALSRADTELHFGGGNRRTQNNNNPYGPQDGNVGTSLGDVYRTRKQELDDMIAHRKEMKGLKHQQKEQQLDTFEKLDDEFAELSQLLTFAKKKNEKTNEELREEKLHQSEDMKEMDDWNAEVKSYMFERKVKATDRTKTPEEIAKEKADELHELEQKRLARMSGDFDPNDDLSDIDDSSEEDDGKKKKHRTRDKKKAKKKTQTKSSTSNPDELDDDEDYLEKEEGLRTKFTSEGLIYLDKEGRMVGKVGEEENKDDDDDDRSNASSSSSSSASSDDDEDDDDEDSHDEQELEHKKKTNSQAKKATVNDDDDSSTSSSDEDESINSDDDELADADKDTTTTTIHPLKVGTKVLGCYRAKEQFDGHVAWYEGVVKAVYVADADKDTVTYDVDYDDGDYEEGMESKYVKLRKMSHKEQTKESKQEREAKKLRQKRQKAKEQARHAMPYVFDVPTTLDALHELIATHAQTGQDVQTIIERIHATHSLRLESHDNNKGQSFMKMQNFYDVLLKRFMAVGDAIWRSGNGGTSLNRMEQLNGLTRILYQMTQEAPEMAGAIWGRRLGILHKAHTKRLRDSEFVPLNILEEDQDVTNNTDNDEAKEEEPFTAWPCLGTVLLLKTCGHLFPVTDRRHVIVTPTLLLIGQILAQTPIRTMNDVTIGLLLCGIMLDMCASPHETQRLAPEALTFLAATLRLFTPNAMDSSHGSPLPSLAIAPTKIPAFTKLRQFVCSYKSRKNRTSGSSGTTNDDDDEESKDDGNDVNDDKEEKTSSVAGLPKISLQRIDLMVSKKKNKRQAMHEEAATRLFTTTLLMIQSAAKAYQPKQGLKGAEREAFYPITEALLMLQPKHSTMPLSLECSTLVAQTAQVVTECCTLTQQPSRVPLRRYAGPSVQELAVKSLAPRINYSTKYNAEGRLGGNTNKTTAQTEAERVRREYKREHKAVKRELRLDASYVEQERRRDYEQKAGGKRQKRHKNFAWLEQQQATINQQVAKGGELLRGGGMGAARAKAASAKLGIKKGGKF